MVLPCWNENEVGEFHSGFNMVNPCYSLRPQNDNFCGVFGIICVQVYKYFNI